MKKVRIYSCVLLFFSFSFPFVCYASCEEASEIEFLDMKKRLQYLEERMYQQEVQLYKHDEFCTSLQRRIEDVKNMHTGITVEDLESLFEHIVSIENRLYGFSLRLQKVEVE